MKAIKCEGTQNFHHHNGEIMYSKDVSLKTSQY